jgi:hypothetical protein
MKKKHILTFVEIIFLIFIVGFATANSELQFRNVSKFPDAPPPVPPGFEQDLKNLTELRENGSLIQDSVKTRYADNVIHLYQGWNLISVPKYLEPGYNTINQVFGGVDTGGRSIYHYDGSTQLWISMQPNSPVIPLVGIYIYSVSPYDVYLVFDADNPDYPLKTLYPQWNMVGYWDVTPITARAELISADPYWTQAIGFDASMQQDESTIYNSDPSWNTEMYPKKGYWLWMTDYGVYTPLAGTKDNRDSSLPTVGVEWGNAYSLPSAQLYWSDVTVTNFYNLFGNYGWKKMFNYGDLSALVNHFTATGDRYYIDGVDFAFYAGHGEAYAINLPTYRFAWFSNCEWGDNDLEWIILHACHTTHTPSNFKSLIHNSMTGVHLICGFNSFGWDSEYGYTGAAVAQKLLMGSGETVKDAWFYGIDECFGPPITLRVIGENEAMLDEKIYGYGPVSDPPVDSYYVVRDHDCK